MNICEHIIQETEIIGIGPLTLEKFPEHTIQEMLNRRKLSFLLVLKQHSFKIESGWLDVGFGESPNQFEQDARADYLKFKDDYEAVKVDIVKLITPKKRKIPQVINH